MDEIAIHENLDDFSKLLIFRALLKHSIEFIVPPHFNPDVTGEMRVVGVNAMKLTKSKAVLNVKFWIPQSFKDTTKQRYCTGLELKRGLSQGTDLSVLAAIKHRLPHAKSQHDIGVRILSATAVARAMIADLNNLHAVWYLIPHKWPAKCTVRVINKSSQICIQADIDNLSVLRHIIKNIFDRQGKIIGSPGHVTPSFLKFCISKNLVFQDQNIFPQNQQKIIKKNSWYCATQPFLTGLRPSHLPGLVDLHLYLMTLTVPFHLVTFCPFS